MLYFVVFIKQDLSNYSLLMLPKHIKAGSQQLLSTGVILWSVDLIEGLNCWNML